MKHRFFSLSAQKLTIVVILVAVLMCAGSLRWAKSSLAQAYEYTLIQLSEEAVPTDEGVLLATPEPASSDPALAESADLTGTLAEATPEPASADPASAESADLTGTLAEATPEPAALEPVAEEPVIEPTATVDPLPEASLSAIADTIASDGYTYVLTANSATSVFSRSALNAGSLIGTLNGGDLPLLATEYIARDSSSAAVLVHFNTANGVVSGYVSEAKLKDIVLSKAEGFDSMNDDGLATEDWSYGGATRTLATVPYSVNVLPVPDDSEQAAPAVVLYEATVNSGEAASVDLRAAASDTADVVASVENGAVVSVLFEEGDWRMVRTETGEEGYLPASLLVATDEIIVPTPEILPDPAPIDGLDGEMGPMADPIDLANLTLSIHPEATNNDGTYKDHYLAGVGFGLAVDINMSSMTTSFPNARVRITAPNEHLQNFTGGDMAGGTKSIVDNGDGTTSITYTFTSLAGGTTMRIPLSANFTNGYTPESYPELFHVDILDDTNTVLKTADTTIFNDVIYGVLTKGAIDNSGGFRLGDGNTSTIYAGQADTASPTHVSSDLTKAYPVTFGFAYHDPSNPSYSGIRYMDKIVFTETLPVGAYFDPTDPINAGWVDNGDGTLTYTADPSNPFSYYGPVQAWLGTVYAKLNLKFPGWDTTQPVTNHASAVFTQLDKLAYETQVVSADDITITLTTSQPGGWFSKSNAGTYYDTTYDKTRAQYWELRSFNQSSNADEENLTIEDYNLDSLLKYNGAALVSPEFTGTMQLEWEDSSGTITIVTSNMTNYATINDAYGHFYPIPDNAVKVRFRVLSGGLAPKKNLYCYISTAFKDPANTHPIGASQTLLNYAKFDFNYANEATTSGVASGALYFNAYHPNVYIQKRCSGSGFVTANQTVGYDFYVGSYGLQTGDSVHGRKIIDILPDGLVYNAGSAAYASGVGLLTNIEPEVVYDYRGSGHTALIWTCSNLPTINGVSNLFADNYTMQINYTTTATVNCAAGANDNTVWFVYDENNTYLPGRQGWQANNYAADIMDLDNDGNTQENGTPLTDPPTDQVDTPVQQPLLTITKTATQTSLRPGDTIDYTITVANSGSSTAVGVQATETLPTNATFTSASTVNGSYNATTRIWSIGDLAVGASATLHMTFTVSSTAVDGSIVVNTATVTQENGVALTAPLATVRTPVATPSLSIDKSSPATVIQPNMDIPYTIRVQNTGVGAAKSVVLNEYLPTNASFKSAGVTSGSYSSATNVWSIGDIAPGGEATLTLVLTASSSLKDGDAVTNTASITQENGRALNPLPTDTVTAPVQINGQLTITKSLSDYKGTAISSTRTFVVRVTGPSYPSGQLVEINNTTPLVLTGLLYGQYRVEELNATAYTVTINGPVTISQASPQATISVTNREKDKSLPVTGESNNHFFVLGGSIMALGMIVLTLSKRRRNNQL